MKINIFLILLLCLKCVVGKTQTNFYNTNPICVDKQYFTDILNEIDQNILKNKKELVYIFHLQINSCPRCEGLIPILYNSLPKDLNKILIFNNSNLNSAIDYIEKNQSFKEIKYSIDKRSKFLNLIDHSNTRLSVPYLYVFNKNNYDFYHIIPLFGLNVDSNLINQILVNDNKLNCVNTKNTLKVENRWNLKKELVNNGRFIYSEKNPKLLNHKIWILDEETDNFFVYDTNFSSVKEIVKDESYFYYYSKNDTEKNYLESLKNMSIARDINLDVCYDNLGLKFYISNSLPSVEFEIKENDTNIFYNNVPNLREIDTNFNYFEKPIKLPLLNNNIYLSSVHSELTLVDSLFFLPVYRGYPTVGTTDEILKDSLNNPFVDTFYSIKNIFEVVSLNKSYGFIGELPQLFTKLKLGYSYFNPQVLKDDLDLIIIDKVSGNISRYSLSYFPKIKKISEINIFPNKKNILLKNIDLYPDKMEYLLDYKSEITFDKILFATIKNGTFMFLIKHGNKIILQIRNKMGDVILNKNTGLFYEENTNYFNLTKNNNAITIYASQFVDRKLFLLKKHITL